MASPRFSRALSALGLLSKLPVLAYLVVLRIFRNIIISDIDFPNAVKQHMQITYGKRNLLRICLVFYKSVICFLPMNFSWLR